jgi:hypothetical protein
MRRRELLAGMVAAVAPAHLPSYAQAKRTVGVLLPRDADSFWTVFRAAMHERGYIEGRDLTFELRTVGEKSFADLAAELVRMNVALIVAHQTPAAQAASAATREIPIVAAAGDLLATGLIQSLSHPGGNVTGVSGMTADVAGKCVELLREALPQASRLAVLANATDPFTAISRPSALGGSGSQVRLIQVHDTRSDRTRQCVRAITPACHRGDSRSAEPAAACSSSGWLMGRQRRHHTFEPSMRGR